MNSLAMAVSALECFSLNTGFKMTERNFVTAVVLALCLLAALTHCESANAQNKVYKESYIFTRKENTSGVNALAAEAKLVEKYNIIEGAGESIVLAIPRTGLLGSLALGDPEVVEYNYHDSRCRTEPVEGYDCEPNWYLETQVEADDPYYKSGKLWGLNTKHGVDANKAWARTVGDSEVVIAVLDTGIATEHEDLKANIWRNPREVPGNGIDDDNNSYIDDSAGFDAISSRGLPFDENGHGTHVAGTIASSGSNSIGVTGVCWDCSILPIKFLGGNGGGSLFAAISGLKYMLAIKKQYNIERMISNNSWGGGGYSPSLKRVIQDAVDAGILFISAAGNSSNDNDARPHYPSNYRLRNTISVAAIDENGFLARFSNYGRGTVDIAAPGVAIYSTYHRGDGYIALSGTSMATPHVSGIAALLWSAHPGESATQIRERILKFGKRNPGTEAKTVTGLEASAFLAMEGITQDEPEPVPDPICRKKRMVTCFKGCKKQYPSKRRKRRQCRRECRKSHDCPRKWHSFITEMLY